jgi:23S rRNA pseudouridine1911/1915/1917 synthase
MHETVPAAFDNERIDRIVAAMVGVTRSDATAYVEQGRVRVNGVVITAKSRKLRIDDDVEIDVPEVDPDAGLVGDPSVVFREVYADDDIIVVDKPAGLVVHPGSGNQTGTLVHGLLARYPDIGELADAETSERPGIVHRLDKGTSGLLVVARTREAAQGLVAQLVDHSMSRRYEALALGTFANSAGLIDAAIGRSDNDPTRMTVRAQGKEARTHYHVLRSYTLPDPVTLLECRLETGRTHQIRVHLSAIGHPVVGDPRYGGMRGAISCPRPWLHAKALMFVHPRSGESMSFTAPVPQDLLDVLAGLE